MGKLQFPLPSNPSKYADQLPTNNWRLKEPITFMIYLDGKAMLEI